MFKFLQLLFLIKVAMNDFLGLDKLADFDLYGRAFVVTLYAIILFRTSSTRLLGNHSTLDLVISIILGSIFGEAIMNKVPLLPSLLSCTFIVVMHRLLAYCAYKSQFFGQYIKGKKVYLIRNGIYLGENLKKCRLTKHDLLQALRLQQGQSNLNLVKNATLERKGEISFILYSK